MPHLIGQSISLPLSPIWPNLFGLLDSHEYACISHLRDILGEEFFIRMGVLKKGPDGEFIMVYPGHIAEILLPCEQRQLYRLHTLTIKLDLGYS